ncbi:hypothetical protein [Absidia glauca]|uniref:Dynein light intermediate chain n=1 Tax=Absidia glauca TaxID=4829 RepID=A0A163THP4_ABSGL|nr:hypothetical protein [Absidia glauca]
MRYDQSGAVSEQVAFMSCIPSLLQCYYLDAFCILFHAVRASSERRLNHPSTTSYVKPDNNGNSNGNIWSSILKGVATSRTVHTKNVLVLGDQSTGKSTLIQHLHSDMPSPLSFSQASSRGLNVTEPTKTKHLALGFSYTTVYDEDNEDMARLGIYQLSTPDHMSLLRFVLNAEMIQDTMILIALDWSQPWNFVSRLQQWIQVIHHTIFDLYKHNPNHKQSMESLCQNVLGYMKQSREVDYDGSPLSGVNGVTAEQVELPLTEGALSVNYGVPLAVVCCKSDKQLMLESTMGYRENRFDYIQQTLRTICMKYGAALFYTSTSHPQTYAQLRQYILHRTFSTDNKPISMRSLYSYQVKAQIVDRDVVVVPAGWDTWGKIKALQKDFDCQQVIERWDIDMGALEDRQPVPDHGLHSVYRDTITDPNVDYQPLVVPSVTICDDEQVVLQRHFDSLQRIGGGGASSSLSKLKASTEPQGTLGTPSSDLLHATDLSSTHSSHTNYDNSTDAEGSTKKLVWDKLNKGSTIPLTTSASDTIIASPPSLPETGNNSASTSNVILNNFFQSLLSKKSSSTSLDAPPHARDAASPGLVDRKDVQKHLAQMQKHSLHT